jgi:hypothetical protein
LRVVVPAVLAAAADAVLVAHHPPKLFAHLVTALARLHVCNLAQRIILEGRRRENFHVEVRHGKQEMPVVLPLQPLELWAPCKARWVWAGAVAKYFFWPHDYYSRQGR